MTPAGGQSPFALSSDPSEAPKFAYGVDVGIGETDNVNLTPADKVSQTIATTDADFTLNERSRLLNAQAKGDFTYLDYLQNAYGGQLIGHFDGTANLAIIPDRVIWTFRDDFGQSSIDAFTPQTPNNIQNVNYFTTGPDLYLRFGGLNFVNVSARYANSQFEDSPFDSNRALGSLTIGHDVSAGADISLIGSAERVMFTNTEVNTDFDHSSVYARYELHGARTDIEADLGITDISENRGRNTGGLAKVQLRRRLSPSNTITLSAGRELTDAGSSFSTLQSGATGFVGTASAPQTSAPYTSDFASAGWRYERNRTTVSATFGWERDIYDGQAMDDFRITRMQFNVTRRLTRALSAQLIASYDKSVYPNAILVSSTVGSSDYEDALTGISLVWRHGRGLEVSLRGDHDYRGTASGTPGYHENRLFLTVGYRPNSVSLSDDKIQ